MCLKEEEEEEDTKAPPSRGGSPSNFDGGFAIRTRNPYRAGREGTKKVSHESVDYNLMLGIDHSTLF